MGDRARASDTPDRAPGAHPEPARLLELCRSWREEMVDAVAELVRIETPSTEAATQAPAFEWLRERFGELDMPCEHTPGVKTGGYLVARSVGDAGRPRQLLLGHCDTVWPVGTLESMPLAIDGDVLKGPGSFDMKGGLVQALFALRALQEEGIRPALAPVMLVNSDEEIGSFESSAAIGELARGAERCFVMEPSLSPGGKLKTRRKGVAQYRLRVTGRAAHAGLNPEEGVSAVLELSLLVPRIFDLNDAERGVSVNVGRIEGGTRANVIASESRALIDVRTPTRADADRIDTALRSLLPSRPGIAIELDGPDGRPPLEPGAAGRRLWRRAQALASEMGLALEEGTAGGGSDGNQTNLYTPTLDGLGAVGDGAHSPNEHVRITAMAERAALLALLLAEPHLTDSREGQPPGS